MNNNNLINDNSKILNGGFDKHNYDKNLCELSGVGFNRWEPLFFNPQKNLDPSWFGFPLMINKNKIKSKKNFLNFLNKNRIETRPIISGNFINQPAIKKYKIKFKRSDLKNSQDIEDRGFFIGLPTEILDRSKINKITNLLLYVNNF